ncbi:MAG: outer membrane beta-barrel protein [Rikenellaceae bacterium]
MKQLRLFWSLLALLFVTNTFAQMPYGKLEATIVDDITGEPITGAVVELRSSAEGARALYYSTGMNGTLSIEQINNGSYKLSVSFIGYKTKEYAFTINGATLTLPTIKMEMSSEKIETIVKEVYAMRTSQSGDTLSYNADAYKVANDADLEGLLEKLPGVTIEDGTVTAQGEEVEKVYVDGREFFGSDVQTAIKTLPAEMVQSIEVFDKLSDEAEFTGVDDGNGFKAINITTRPGMRNGVFGKIMAGGGYEPDSFTNSDYKYTSAANVNIFNEGSRLSIIGMANNVDQQNFSFEDLLGTQSSGGRGRGGRGGGGSASLMLPSVPGVSTVNSIGANYSNEWGEKKNIKLSASYLFNNSDTEDVDDTYRIYTMTQMQDTLDQVEVSNTFNANHRLDGRFEWTGTRQRLMIRPSFGYQGYDPYSLTIGSQYNGDDITNIFDESFGDKAAYTIGLSANYNLLLGQRAGRMLTLNGSYKLSNTAKDSYTASGEDVDDPDMSYRFIDNPSSTQAYSMGVSYNEPLRTNLTWISSYNYNVSDQSTDQLTYNTDSDYTYSESDLLSSASNSFDTKYLTHKIGTGLRLNKGKGREATNIVARINYEHSSLSSEIVDGDNRSTIWRDYDFLTYNVVGQLYINSTNSLRLTVTSSTDSPSVTDLEDMYDLSNTNYISRGNPLLEPEYTNRANVRYIRTSVDKGSTFMVYLSGSVTNNSVATHTVYSPGEIVIDGDVYDPLEYSMPTNLDGDLSLSLGTSYGFPLGFLKSNFNLGGSVSYGLSPTIVGGTINSDGSISGGVSSTTNEKSYKINTTLGSNISENVDFTLKWRGSYSDSIDEEADSERSLYFSHTASATMKYVLWGGITLASTLSYTENLGVSYDFQETSLVWGASLGKKIFRNKRGEMNITVNDILDQNNPIKYSVGDNYTQTSTESTIGRYFLLSFTYNLREFAGGEKGERPERGDGQMGAPGMGGGGMGMGGPGGGMGGGMGGPGGGGF